MKKVLLILLFFPFIGIGQDCDYGGDLEDANELCDLMDPNFSFSTDKDADRALDRILSVTGLAKRFVLMRCDNVNNAAAVTYKGIRYILYNKDFMKIIVDNTNSWSNISILAHEIGHHVNAHTLGTEDIPTLTERRQMELEADEFSGFVMYKLGATLKESQKAVSLISTNDDDSYSTHPSKNKRLKAIEKGYNNAKNQKENYLNHETLTAEDYYYIGEKYYKNKQWQLAVDNFTRVVEINPNMRAAYQYRGYAQYRLVKNRLAINDFTKSILISPTRLSYYYRGLCYERTEEYGLALNDYSAALEFDRESVELTFRRGYCYEKLNQYRLAIEDYTFCIESPNETYHKWPEFYRRGLCYEKINMYKQACLDFKKACTMGSESGCLKYKRICK